MEGDEIRDSMFGIDGMFVVFEGIDGAGTTTQAERFAATLRKRKRLVHVTHEPSSGPVGSLVRLVLSERLSMPGRSGEAMALLFAADRLDHIECEIAPLLRDGYVVISDRFDLSSLTYQAATADRDDEEKRAAWIRELNRHAKRPHFTVVIDVAPEVAAERRRARGGMRELYDDPELQARLAAAYKRAESLVPGDRVFHVDGNGDVDSVSAAILAALEPHLR